jgi:signal peptidase I
MSGHRGRSTAAREQGSGADVTRPGPRWHRRLLRNLLLLAGLAILFTVPTRAFVAQAFVVPSGSMADTLRPGDQVLVNKLVYHLRGVHRGDIVVFSGTGSSGPAPSPAPGPLARWYRDALTAAGLASNGTDYVKRVIGLPGDHVACCDAHGLITVNGIPLHEDGYLYPGERPSDQPFQVTVPPGRLWVMGDHRADSEDSRDHPDDPGDGTIPESAVVGRAFVVVWPPSQLGSLPIPATFSRSSLLHPRTAPPRPAVAPGSPPSSAIGAVMPLAGAPRPPGSRTETRAGRRDPAGGDPGTGPRPRRRAAWSALGSIR